MRFAHMIGVGRRPTLRCSEKRSRNACRHQTECYRRVSFLVSSINRSAHIYISRTCRARFPADHGSLDAAADSRQLSSILVFVCSAPAGRGLQHGLASLGLFSSWLSSAGVLSVVKQSCRQGRPVSSPGTLPKLWLICFQMA